MTYPATVATIEDCIAMLTQAAVILEDVRFATQCRGYVEFSRKVAKIEDHNITPLINELKAIKARGGAAQAANGEMG